MKELADLRLETQKRGWTVKEVSVSAGGPYNETVIGWDIEIKKADGSVVTYSAPFLTLAYEKALKHWGMEF